VLNDWDTIRSKLCTLHFITCSLFLYLIYQINANISFRGGPHRTTTNSVTRETHEDDNHVTGRLSSRGSLDEVIDHVHVYLDNTEKGEDAYGRVSKMRVTIKRTEP
jgi:hypothetical protein